MSCPQNHLLSKNSYHHLIGFFHDCVSPLTIQTLFAITEWEEKTIKIREIKDQLENISSVEEYTYLFLEYTIIVRNIPTIPTKDYDKFKPLIEAEYYKISNEIKNKVEKNIESYSKPN